MEKSLFDELKSPKTTKKPPKKALNAILKAVTLKLWFWVFKTAFQTLIIYLIIKHLN